MNRQRYTIIDERFGDGIEPVTTEQFFDMVEDHAAESDWADAQDEDRWSWRGTDSLWFDEDGSRTNWAEVLVPA